MGVILGCWRCYKITHEKPRSVPFSQDTLILTRQTNPRPFGVLFLIGALFSYLFILYLPKPDTQTLIRHVIEILVISGFFGFAGYSFLTTGLYYTLKPDTISYNNKTLRWTDIVAIEAHRTLPGEFAKEYLRAFVLKSVKDGGEVITLSLWAELKEISSENLGELLQTYCAKNGNPLKIQESIYPGKGKV
jgi:hypothetical protein